VLLKPLDKHKEKRGIKFATCDIEAWDWTNFIVAGFYDGEKNFYKYFVTLKEFVEYTFDYCKKHKIKNLFAHFGGKYDFSFFLEELTFNDRFKVDSIIPRGSMILSFDVTTTDPKDKFTLTYRDSSALLPYGLASLGDAFGVDVQKDEMDFHNLKEAWENKDYTRKLRLSMMPNPENINESVQRYDIVYDDNGKLTKYFDKLEGKWHTKGLYNKGIVLEYLRKDCVSLYQVIQSFYQWPLVRMSGPSTTTASQAVKIWRLFLDRDIHSVTSDAVDNFIRDNCYYGGRTEVFRPMFDATYDLKENYLGFKGEALKIIKEQQGKKLYYVDVNSLYPTVMQSMDYPVKFSHAAFGKNGYFDNINKIGFWDVEVKVPKDMLIPPLPINHTFENGSRKLIFPTGTFRGKWSIYEIEYAKSLGVEVTKYHEGLIFVNGGKVFEKFITSLYDMRLEAKKKGDGVGDLNCKLIMNSCYGRLGLQTERSNLVIDDGSVGLKEHSMIDNKGKKVRLMERPVSLDKSFTNVAIPAMVTSYARVLMHKLGRKIGQEHIYYMDTDSYFIDKPWPSGDKLGELKLEYTCTSACFLLPKTYLNSGIEGENVDKKVTMKGFPKKKIQHFTAEDFFLALRGDLKRLKIKNERKFMSFKEAAKAGRFLGMKNDPKVKREIDEYREKMYYERTGKRKRFVKEVYEDSYREIKSQYDKRIVTNQGLTSKPIHLTNNKET
jgi:hypothetical protein